MFKRGTIYWTKVKNSRTGKYKAVSLETKNKALGKQREAKLKVESAEGRFFETCEGDSMTIRELLDMFLNRTADKRTFSTIRQEGYLIKKLNEYFGDMLLPKIKAIDIEKYVQARRSQGMADGSIGHELNRLKGAYKLAAGQWELLKSNPFDKVGKIPRSKIERCRYLLPQESERLLNELFKPGNEWLRDVVIFARETGLRISNIVDLQWRQVDLSNKTITIEGHFTKTGKPLFIPMSRNVFHILSEIRRADRHEEVVFAKWHNRKKKYMRTITRRASQDFREMCDGIGLEDFRFHDLRHDFCSRLVQAGQPLQVVQQLAGHTDIAMTQRYAHLSPQQKEAAIATFDEPRAGKDEICNNLVTVG